MSLYQKQTHMIVQFSLFAFLLKNNQSECCNLCKNRTTNRRFRNGLLLAALLFSRELLWNRIGRIQSFVAKQSHRVALSDEMSVVLELVTELPKHVHSCSKCREVHKHCNHSRHQPNRRRRSIFRHLISLAHLQNVSRHFLIVFVAITGTVRQRHGPILKRLFLFNVLTEFRLFVMRPEA